MVTPFRTLRLKQPTVDLVYDDGHLNGIDNGVLVSVALGNENMVSGVIYGLDVVRGMTSGSIDLVKPRERKLKKLLTNMDVIRRAVASVAQDSSLTGALIDITAMSFKMRSKVYEAAQARATANWKLIVTFGVGRF